MNLDDRSHRKVLGDTHGQGRPPKLTLSERKAAVRLYWKTTAKQAAQQYGVTPMTIRNWARAL